MIGYIYKLYDSSKTEEVRYVGKTVRKLDKRLTEHLRPAELKEKTHKNDWIKKVIREENKVMIKIIESVNIEDKKELNPYEVFYVKLFRDLGHKLTNATDGGDGGCNMNQETRDKIAKSRIGKKHSEESKLKISESLFGNSYALGFKHSEETKEKESKSQTGRKHSEETKEKMRVWNTGRKMSPESVEKSRLAKIGKKATEESKKRMSEAQKGREHSEETKQKMSEYRKEWWRKKKESTQEMFVDI